MPWTASTFRSRHNKGLSPGQSRRAAKIANGILRSTGDEKLAIATANARVKGNAPRGKKRRST